MHRLQRQLAGPGKRLDRVLPQDTAVLGPLGSWMATYCGCPSLTVDVHHFLHGADSIGIGSLLKNLVWQRLQLEDRHNARGLWMVYNLLWAKWCSEKEPGQRGRTTCGESK